jgi:hypothetical protein
MFPYWASYLKEDFLGRGADVKVLKTVQQTLLRRFINFLSHSGEYLVDGG